MIRDHDPVHTAARAVDVGYFNTKYTLGRKQVGGDLPIATGMFPSLAPQLRSATDFDTPAAKKADGCVIEVEGVRYFVGNEAVFNSTGAEPRPVAEDYALTARYLALLRGALHYMLVDAGNPDEMVIDNLVLGLPLTTFAAHRAGLARRAAGEHLIPFNAGARRVTVGAVHVIPQPHGALLNLGASASKGEADGWTLVVDVGGGTVDWYVGKERNVNFQRSGAHRKAMLACAAAVAEALDPTWLDQFEVMGRIDAAIRERKVTFRVQGEEHALAPHLNAIDAVMEESLEKILTKVQGLGDIERILLTGGGAAVFGEFLERRQPKLVKLLHIDRDPMFSNVRGFQVYGELQQAKAGAAHGAAR